MKRAMTIAIDYLISIQEPDGSWRDYCLPVGESDQWVTAFTALGVFQASRKLDYDKGIDASDRAAKFLKDFQEYSSGWGYNRQTGIDADSTAHVIRLLRELNLKVDQKDEDCLIRHYDGSGAFRTYCIDSEWGSPHPDVTAASGLALKDDVLCLFREDLIKYCKAVRLPDGAWPTYWWRNHQYGTFYVLELLERMDEKVSLDPKTMEVKIQSCFDLAWSIGIISFLKADSLPIDRPIQILMDLQEISGAWPGSPSLRVTDPECKKPWISSQGDYYTDINSTITTSSVLRVLSRLL
jgi:hypothetical protein